MEKAELKSGGLHESCAVVMIESGLLLPRLFRLLSLCGSDANFSELFGYSTESRRVITNAPLVPWLKP